jgi:hypothetical protein
VAETEPTSTAASSTLTTSIATSGRTAPCGDAEAREAHRRSVEEERETAERGWNRCALSGPLCEKANVRTRGVSGREPSDCRCPWRKHEPRYPVFVSY